MPTDSLLKNADTDPSLRQADEVSQPEPEGSSVVELEGVLKKIIMDVSCHPLEVRAWAERLLLENKSKKACNIFDCSKRFALSLFAAPGAATAIGVMSSFFTAVGLDDDRFKNYERYLFGFSALMIFQGVVRMNGLKLPVFPSLVKQKIWNDQSRIKRLLWAVVLLAAIVQPFQWAVGAAELFTEGGFNDFLHKFDKELNLSAHPFSRKLLFLFNKNYAPEFLSMLVGEGFSILGWLAFISSGICNITLTFGFLCDLRQILPRIFSGLNEYIRGKDSRAIQCALWSILVACSPLILAASVAPAMTASLGSPISFLSAFVTMTVEAAQIITAIVGIVGLVTSILFNKKAGAAALADCLHRLGVSSGDTSTTGLSQTSSCTVLATLSEVGRTLFFVQSFISAILIGVAYAFLVRSNDFVKKVDPSETLMEFMFYSSLPFQLLLWCFHTAVDGYVKGRPLPPVLRKFLDRCQEKAAAEGVVDALLRSDGVGETRATVGDPINSDGCPRPSADWCSFFCRGSRNKSNLHESLLNKDGGITVAV